MSYPRSQWFQPGDGIAREVITADIQRYLGNDALVRPGKGTGEYKGIDGYWITAYRALTSQMVQDLKMDSQRWRAEVQQGRGSPYGSVSPVPRRPNTPPVAYQDSRTHQSRQYYGPTTPAPEVSYAAQPSPAYASSRSSGSSHSAYSGPPTSSYGESYTHAAPPPSYSHTSASYPAQGSYASTPTAYGAAQPRTASQTPYPYGSAAAVPREPEYSSGYSSGAYNTQPVAVTPREPAYGQPPQSAAPQYLDPYGRPIQYSRAPTSGRRH